MAVSEYGMRIDSITLFQNIINRRYEPVSNTDKTVYAAMKKWYRACGEPEIAYLYYGSEFCKKRFPGTQEWLQIAEFCHQHNKTLVMVTPPTDDNLQNKIIQIVRMLEQRNDRCKLEIEINDYGLMHRLSRMECFEHKLVLRLGRLLDKTFHDGRLDEQDIGRLYGNCPVKWTEDEHWLSEKSQCALNRYGIRGLDLDLPTGAVACKQEAGYSVGMFVPYSYATTGGICQMQNIGRSPEEKFDGNNDSCPKNCTKYYEIMKKRVIDIHGDNPGLQNGYLLRDIVMYRAGNTVFFLNPKEPDDILNHAHIQRLIFEPKLLL